MTEAVILNALDGSNPLAFLAALGTLRLLSICGSPARIRWVRQGVWLPELQGVESSKEAVCERLCEAARKRLPIDTFTRLLGKNITVDKATFRHLVQAAYDGALAGDGDAADFTAAFGSEVCEQARQNRIEHTDLCFITGSGHQHFLGTMKALDENVTAAHIEDALFGAWTENKGLSMRWDPADASEYAFRWSDPSLEGASSVWGANLLAVHGLPFFPCHPTDRGLRTTGFYVTERAREFTWPIWTHPAGADTVRSLLAIGELQKSEDGIDHRKLGGFGIAEVYRAPRVRIGQGANFKVSFRPARAV